MIQLTLDGRITVLKFLDIIKVIYFLLVTKLHSNTIDLLYEIQGNFILQREKAIMKQSTLGNNYEKGGIKNIELRNKITSM